ncbi:nitroreductase family protein [Marivirga sp. S37H4]|uniref:Nitroreductase family protein n=1 Tax=Marivirga aurantiaca TaxID=2802615 RepID=A0A934X167_9BACT|nr:nitroreductase family protein [Marivirga aurantiaca]MBK6267068.1 nitroreductase family protein [Marivirga aurantiaca]
MKIVNEKLPYVFYRNKVLASIYYFLFSRSFLRENKAVLNGKVQYLKQSQSNKANIFLLVRNTHKLEKGLLMRPRRAVFAASYIEETVSCFIKLAESGDDIHTPQFKWFYDVLDEYFAVVQGGDKTIDFQMGRFKAVVESINFELKSKKIEQKSIPYKHSSIGVSPISYEDFFKLSKQRRSVRWFEQKAVPRELVDKAILAAIQAPSACNRQPFQFRIIDDKNILSKIVNYPMGTTGYAENIPMMIVVTGNLDAYFSERDRHVIYIDGSLASMSFMYALETLGLSSCSINWPDIEQRERKMQKLLKLKDFQRVIMCIGVGYADPEGYIAFSEKRSLDEIRKYN